MASAGIWIAGGLLILVIVGIVIGVIVWMSFGKGGMGESCSANSDCVDGLACDLNDNVCRVAEGDPCKNDSDCFSSDRCSADNICVPQNPPLACIGDPCTTGSDCVSTTDLLCDDITKTCLVPSGGECKNTTDCISANECKGNICSPIDTDPGDGNIGDPCISDSECISELVCDIGIRECRQPRGSNCFSDGECLSTNICDANVCVIDTSGEFGDVCDIDMDCIMGLACDPSDQMCVMDSGSPCEEDEDCLSNNICDENNICVGTTNFGESCNDDSDCALGLACDSLTRTCKVAENETCIQDSNCVSEAPGCNILNQCTPRGDGLGLLLDPCTSASDCRPVFNCDTIRMVCVSREQATCRTDEECETGRMCLYAVGGFRCSGDAAIGSLPFGHFCNLEIQNCVDNLSCEEIVPGADACFVPLGGLCFADLDCHAFGDPDPNVCEFVSGSKICLESM